ncbi:MULTISPECIES: exodeoxyribonuclease V subunit beta [unclassified Leptospira]|uniref:UvrD-helicase domain-containing protein n=1 Tax=unclassified Leptospira TaxID=2633828 RepID=UPI0002BEE509|nr:MULTISPECIES: UvrD-helicase domain-containing protein [unclassified Leptospira]EMJ99442.1 putative exodeoxyribonuclease V, beta subunit [Leptospira sp. B5-022]MCR1792293.1 UvrD-helicase domain-containing protein [Leptospira sp. id769339]
MQKSKLEPIASSFADQIDITKNGFIGASAGTGKTHTIVFLVLKILKDSFKTSLSSEKPPFGIESILVLTYTDKAASELKGRIRAELKNTIQRLEKLESPTEEESKELDYFLNQASRLDQAYISTIHGFAHKISKEYSLESGSSENSELIEEFSVVSKALYRRMRAEFGGKYPKELLPFILSQANRFYNDGFQGTTWENFVSGLAVKKVSSPESIQLLPRPQEFPQIASIKNVFLEIQSILPKFLEFQDSLKKKINTNKYKALASRQTEFQDSLNKLVDSSEPFSPFPFTLALKKILDLKRGESSGIESVLLSDEELKTATSEPGYLSYTIEREKIRKLSSSLSSLESSLSSFLVSLAEDLAEDSVKIKEEDNSITYGDMILGLSDSLEKNPELVAELKKRFRFGIIDEFQDTDPDQYNIFRILFLERSSNAETEGKLFLIGDAKQSIYGFRGADLGTYLAAKREFDSGGKFAASSIVYPELDTNRRSLPELISSYNSLFGSVKGEWFPIEETGFLPIEYVHVKSPENPGKAILYSDTSNRAALNVFSLSKESNADRLKDQYSKFIAEEIIHLVSEKSEIYIKKEGYSSPEKLSWSDISILVRGENDLEFLKRQFKVRGIPYTYSKQTGLFGSPEAIRVREILQCLNEEGSRDSFYKLLISDLFCVSPENLQNYEEYPIESGEKRLLETWRKFSRKKDFPGLFGSILTESKLASPLPQEARQDWERKITNFKQIFFFLTEKASKSDQTLGELITYLESKMVSKEDEKDYLEKDSEEDRVKISTIHSCKGLEFPIVFLFGGFSGWGAQRKKFSEYREGEKRIIDLENNKEEEAVYTTVNEDKRLYYVALTRAMYKFYFPLLAEPDTKRPLELFRKSFQAAVSEFPEDSSVARFWENEEGKYEQEWIRNHKTISGLTLDRIKEEGPEILRSVEIWPDKAEKRKVILESYSSLDSFFTSEGLGFQVSETKSFKTDETPDESREEELPSSNKMGNLLHQLLETEDFSIYQNVISPKQIPENILRSYKNILKSYGYGDNPEQLDLFAKKISELFWNTLKTPLSHSKKNISLCEISPLERKHEVDFFLKIPGQTGNGDLLKGTLDLIFRSEGKYWILDWKSNRLSSNFGEDPYSENYLREKIQESYSLQLAIYSVVLDDWLRFKYGTKYDPKLLGGMYFVFLRGTDPNRLGRGIFYQDLDPEFVKISKEKIKETLDLKNKISAEKE